MALAHIKIQKKNVIIHDSCVYRFWVAIATIYRQIHTVNLLYEYFMAELHIPH